MATLKRKLNLIANSFRLFVNTGDGTSVTGLSSAALGGIVAGVFIAAVLLSTVVIIGYCCWNNYQESRMFTGGYSSNAGATAGAQRQNSSAAYTGDTRQSSTQSLSSNSVIIAAKDSPDVNQKAAPSSS